MKQYTLTWAEQANYKHPHPERTARKTGRGLSCNDTFQIWNSASAMLVSVRMQESRASTSYDWRPIDRKLAERHERIERYLKIRKLRKEKETAVTETTIP